MKDVKRIDEWTNEAGEIVEVEITFTDGSKVTYTAGGEKIERNGNL